MCVQCSLSRTFKLVCAVTVKADPKNKCPHEQSSTSAAGTNEEASVDASLQKLVISLALKAARQDHVNDLKLREE